MGRDLGGGACDWSRGEWLATGCNYPQLDVLAALPAVATGSGRADRGSAGVRATVANRTVVVYGDSTLRGMMNQIVEWVDGECAPP